MPTFKYKALNLDGKKVEGAEEAPSKNALVGILEAQGLLLLSARKSARQTTAGSPLRVRRQRFQKVPLDDLILFTRQFATLFKVGVPLLRILYILKDQVEKPRLQGVIAAIAKDIESGASLAEAFSKHPKIFPPIYCSMLAAGEASGNIAVVMENLCDSMAYEQEVKKLIRGALQYPVIVLCTLAAGFCILMGFVFPAFLPIFDKLGGELPVLTKVCIAISQLFTEYWLAMLGSLTAFIALIFFANRTDSGRLILARICLRFPLVGRLLNYSFMARFGSLLSILQSSGILITDALRIIADCISNQVLRREIEQVSLDVEAGKSIEASLHHSTCFPLIMKSMISIGETSGNLEQMMAEASRHFELEVHHAVKRLTGALGPLLIVIMAIAVGFFALAIYLPLWDVGKLAMGQ